MSMHTSRNAQADLVAEIKLKKQNKTKIFFRIFISFFLFFFFFPVVCNQDDMVLLALIHTTTTLPTRSRAKYAFVRLVALDMAWAVLAEYAHRYSGLSSIRVCHVIRHCFSCQSLVVSRDCNLERVT